MLVSSILQKNVKMILMSGTPLNNPSEIYDLCNLLYDENLEVFPDNNSRKN